MVYGKNLMARYQVLPDSTGNRYRFFCEASGIAVCTTAAVKAETPEREVLVAWESEGKARFNYCIRCRRWVCDAMYNADVCLCADCAPWEDPPNFCKRCGQRISKENLFCGKCGDRAMYGEVWT